jgi:MoaA/NifB/PqqE/SkfB family radical SAM enzyme
MGKHRDAYFQIFTNGTMINNRIADNLSRNGNALVLFSLEGFADYTDFRRGKDVFHKVTNAMSLLKEKGVLFGTSILVTPNNFDIVTSVEFIEDLIKRGAFFAWYLTYKPVGDKLDLTLLFPPHQRHLLSEKVFDIRNSFPIIAIDHENDVAPIGGCLATNCIGIHINAKGGIEPCGILHYYDTFVKQGEAIEDSIRNSSLLNEMKSFNSTFPSCPLIDRPLELSEIIKRTFPETYTHLTDFNFLQEYIREYTKTPGYQERIAPVTRKDLYTHLAEYLLHAARS